jgi:hypothetical protein
METDQDGWGGGAGNVNRSPSSQVYAKKERDGVERAPWFSRPL